MATPCAPSRSGSSSPPYATANPSTSKPSSTSPSGSLNASSDSWPCACSCRRHDQTIWLSISDRGLSASSPLPYMHNPRRNPDKARKRRSEKEENGKGVEPRETVAPIYDVHRFELYRTDAQLAGGLVKIIFVRERCVRALAGIEDEVGNPGSALGRVPLAPAVVPIAENEASGKLQLPNPRNGIVRLAYPGTGL